MANKYYFFLQILCYRVIITVSDNLYGENFMNILEAIGTNIQILGHNVDIEFITAFVSDANLQGLADGEANKIYIKTRAEDRDIPDSIQVSHLIHEVLEQINLKSDGWFFGGEGDEKESKISMLAEIITQIIYAKFTK